MHQRPTFATFGCIYPFNKNLQRDVENMFAHVLNLFLIKPRRPAVFYTHTSHVGVSMQDITLNCRRNLGWIIKQSETKRVHMKF